MHSSFIYSFICLVPVMNNIATKINVFIYSLGTCDDKYYCAKKKNYIYFNIYSFGIICNNCIKKWAFFYFDNFVATLKKQVYA